MTRTKEDWRRLLMEARRALGAAVRAAHSRAIVAQLARRPEFVASRAVLVYLPIGAEVDPMPLVHDAQSTGKMVYHPHGDVNAPRWLRIAEGEPRSVPDAMPVVVPSEKPLLVVVPALGFDIEGGRLGRGGGFYDRALGSLRHTTLVFSVGVCFEAQVVPRLPCDSWDQRVDLVVTEDRCIVPGSSLDPPQARRQVQEVQEP